MFAATAELRDEVQLLVNDCDPGPLGAADAREAHRNGLDQDFPVVFGKDAGKNFHQRRLAGTVLAHERVNLSGAEVEIDAVEGHDPAETLGYAGGAEEIRAGTRYPVADVGRAGHASRTPPAVPPLPLGRGVGKRQARSICALWSRNPRYRHWQYESALRYRLARTG